MKPNPPAVSNTPPAVGSAPESVEQMGWGDAVLQPFRTRLFHGFRQDFQHDSRLWMEATRSFVHAIRTFGSEEKAHSWLTSPCGALAHERPYDLLKQGKGVVVEEELDRIGHGVFV